MAGRAERAVGGRGRRGRERRGGKCAAEYAIRCTASIKERQYSSKSWRSGRVLMMMMMMMIELLG